MSPIEYDDADRAVELCVDWLTHTPSQTLANFYAAFIQRFGLIPVSQTQFYDLAKVTDE